MKGLDQERFEHRHLDFVEAEREPRHGAPLHQSNSTFSITMTLSNLIRPPDQMQVISIACMSYRVPWSLGNLNLVDCFPPGSQAFEVNFQTLIHRKINPGTQGGAVTRLSLGLNEIEIAMLESQP